MKLYFLIERSRKDLSMRCSFSCCQVFPSRTFTNHRTAWGRKEHFFNSFLSPPVALQTLKMAPRVEKTGIFKKRFKFCKLFFLCEMHHEQTFFIELFPILSSSLFPIFTMKVSSAALIYLNANLTLNFAKTFLNILKH